MKLHERIHSGSAEAVVRYKNNLLPLKHGSFDGELKRVGPDHSIVMPHILTEVGKPKMYHIHKMQLFS